MLTARSTLTYVARNNPLVNEWLVIVSGDDCSTEPALDNAATAGGVAQLNGHSTAAALHITKLTNARMQNVWTSPQLTGFPAGHCMLLAPTQPTCNSIAAALDWIQ